MTAPRSTSTKSTMTPEEAEKKREEEDRALGPWHTVAQYAIGLVLLLVLAGALQALLPDTIHIFR